MAQVKNDLARTLFSSAFIAILAGGCFWVLQPFIPSLIWATMIVVATWPLLLRAEKRLKSHNLAVALMVFIVGFIVIVPIGAASAVIFSRADDAIAWIQDLPNYTLPSAPAWLERIPAVGIRMAARWNALSQEGAGGLAKLLQPYGRQIINYISETAQSTGILFLHLLLTVVLTGILYATGETATRGLKAFANRLAGERGIFAIDLAGQSIKAVAMGIVLTALVQTLLGGLGLLAAGVPALGLFFASIFILCIAQLGPLIPMLVAVTWLFRNDQNVSGSILLGWTLIVATLDNFLRPILIKKGADLPLLLIFAGVLGGLFAFGVVGLFIGPVFLAVTFRLLQAWVDEQEKEDLMPQPIGRRQILNTPTSPNKPLDH